MVHKELTARIYKLLGGVVLVQVSLKTLQRPGKGKLHIELVMGRERRGRCV